jgi:putative PIN family toxin of toxin-antitoxin system
MGKPQVVIDTNVIVAGVRSKRGSSFRLLSLVGTGLFDIHLSVPLVLEYEEVLVRLLQQLPIDRDGINDLIDYHCAVAVRHEIFYLWRPVLRDPSDDMVLEVAVHGGCENIITFNSRDFANVGQFGIELIDPGTFLQRIGGLV